MSRETGRGHPHEDLLVTWINCTAPPPVGQIVLLCLDPGNLDEPAGVCLGMWGGDHYRTLSKYGTPGGVLYVDDLDYWTHFHEPPQLTQRRALSEIATLQFSSLYVPQ